MGNEASQNVKYGERLDNDINVNWSKLEVQNKYCAPRDGHAAASIARKMYVFGGVVSRADGEHTESNELFSLDLDNNTWTCVETKGDLPPPRSSAAMSAVENNLYLFGGLNQTSGWLDDLHCFDTETCTWSKVEGKGQCPSPRDKLASAVVGKNVYFFGGFGPKNEEEEVEEVSTEEEDALEDEGMEADSQEAAQFGWFNDLFIFDTETSSWSHPMQMNAVGPTPRAATGMCAVKNKLVIFGGRDSQARRNDLYIYNIETRKWETVSVKGCQPEPRSFHTVTAVGARVVVIGGRSQSNQHYDDLNIFDTATMEWMQPTVQGELPSGRGVHTSVVVDDQLVLFGGSSDFNPETMQCQKYHNEVYTTRTVDILQGGSIANTEANQENFPISTNIPVQENTDIQKSVSGIVPSSQNEVN
ncbi:kelch domain-containing protein 1 [Lingula anatina]|uniref:Kelch domain-containing protein 1 n=1 Tax=Lingula anatina TaxID=7574 RepID=A0A1S3JC84_LINAN|nr:kelch domain-containing protein 1 [Lingula anatina]|eukprot:XP_013407938.1 kelch domain-containing protein 1 [Lingula anatina]